MRAVRHVLASSGQGSYVRSGVRALLTSTRRLLHALRGRQCRARGRTAPPALAGARLVGPRVLVLLV